MKMKKAIALGIAIALLLCGCTQQQEINMESNPSIEETLPECILEFHGTVTINEEAEPLDLYYYKESEQNYSYKLVVAGQSKTSPLRKDFIPSTVMYGFEIQDVNQDGIHDIIIELGVYGKMKPADCFIGTAELDYIQVAGFSELYNPVWMPASGTIIDSGRGGAGEYWMDRYEVHESELVLIESLSWKYTDGSSPKYTEKKIINGKTVIVQDSVSESEIDIERWYQ